MKKAFTVVEVMIVVVIIGLLAAMAIPAFQKVKYSSLAKAYKNGQSLTTEERKYVIEYRSNHPKDFETETTASVEHTSVPATLPQFLGVTAKGDAFQTVVVEGKTYILVPKQDAQESVIAGKTYWLIPRSP